VVWLPDSSGFLFTAPFGANQKHVEIFHFNLSDGRIRHVTQSSTATRIPAISPDGEQFALIRATAAATSVTVQIDIFDLSGRRIRASDPLSLAADNQGLSSTTCDSAGIWSPKGRHILFWFLNPGPRRGGGWFDFGYDPPELHFGEYDLQSGKTQEIQVMPIVSLHYIGVSPISDDDRGFLATPIDKEKQMTLMPFPLLFVEWDGTQHQIKASPEAQGRLASSWVSLLPPGGELGDKITVDRLKMWPIVPLPRGRWSSGTLFLEMPEGRLRIDTGRRIATYESDEQLTERRNRLLDERIVDSVPVGKDYTLYVRVPVIPETERYTRGFVHQYELVDERDGKSRPLGSGWWLMSSAPDNKSVVVTCGADGKKGRMIVINEEKGILATMGVRLRQ
jgi:hypothetical protein